MVADFWDLSLKLSIFEIWTDISAYLISCCYENI